MKRANNLFDQITDWHNLRLAYYKALKRKRLKPDARSFGERLDQELNEMAKAVQECRVCVGQGHQFRIFDPKERIITAPCFRERVLHHAIMNVCGPVLERSLIDDTFACRVGKGRIVALQRAREFASKYEKNARLCQVHGR